MRIDWQGLGTHSFYDKKNGSHCVLYRGGDEGEKRRRETTMCTHDPKRPTRPSSHSKKIEKNITAKFCWML